MLTNLAPARKEVAAAVRARASIAARRPIRPASSHAGIAAYTTSWRHRLRSPTTPCQSCSPTRRSQSEFDACLSSVILTRLPGSSSTPSGGHSRSGEGHADVPRLLTASTSAASRAFCSSFHEAGLRAGVADGRGDRVSARRRIAGLTKITLVGRTGAAGCGRPRSAPRVTRRRGLGTTNTEPADRRTVAAPATPALAGGEPLDADLHRRRGNGMVGIPMNARPGLRFMTSAYGKGAAHGPVRVAAMTNPARDLLFAASGEYERTGLSTARRARRARGGRWRGCHERPLKPLSDLVRKGATLMV